MLKREKNNMGNSNEKSREAGIDILKLICCMAVLANHVFDYGTECDFSVRRIIYFGASYFPLLFSPSMAIHFLDIQ